MGKGGLGTTADENGSIIWLIWEDIASKGFGYSGRILHQKDLANLGDIASKLFGLSGRTLHQKDLANLGG